MGRVRELHDRTGNRNVVLYDLNDRVSAIAIPSLQRIVMFQYALGPEANGKLESVSLVDTSTGHEIKRVTRGDANRKYYEVDDPEFENFLYGYIITIEDPFPPLFDQNWIIWGPKPPFQCSLLDCQTACDSAFNLSLLACTAVTIANSAAGLTCGAVALSAWVSCKNKCTANCN